MTPVLWMILGVVVVFIVLGMLILVTTDNHMSIGGGAVAGIGLWCLGAGFVALVAMAIIKIVSYFWNGG